MDTLRKRPPLTDGLSKTTQAHNTTITARIKRGVILLALWRVYSFKTATAILRSLGVSDA